MIQSIIPPELMVIIKGQSYSKLDPNIAFYADINKWVLLEEYENYFPFVFNTYKQQGVNYKINEIPFAIGITYFKDTLFKSSNYFFQCYDVFNAFFSDTKYLQITPEIETMEESNKVLSSEVYTIDTIKNPIHARILKCEEVKTKFINDLDLGEKDWESIKSFTYGIEFETKGQGKVSLKTLVDTSMYPVRDGSLDGGIEYVTGIIKNEYDLKKLKYFCDIATKYLYCHIDKGSCHLHVGNIPKLTKTTFVSLYMTMLKLQSEIKDYLPDYREKLEYLARKNSEYKNYCKDLPGLGLLELNTIEEKYLVIWKWLNETNTINSGNEFDNPNHFRAGSSKWNWKTRYYLLNFVSYFFEDKTTIEFRSHHMTFDFTELYTWIVICTSVIKYAIENPNITTNNHSKLFLRTVIRDPKILDYIKEKKQLTFNNYFHG